MNILGLSSSVHIAHTNIVCYSKFFLSRYTQVLCQSRLCKSDQVCLNYLMLQWQFIHLNGGKLDQRKVYELSSSQSQSHITTDGQSISKSWCQAPSAAHDQIFITLWQLRVLFFWGALSDERRSLSFVYAAGPRQSSLSRVRVPWISRPYFSVSVLRLPFSSPPTTSRVKVEAFEPASTRAN
jgi:hypothetical protein